MKANRSDELLCNGCVNASSWFEIGNLVSRVNDTVGVGVGLGLGSGVAVDNGVL